LKCHSSLPVVSPTVKPPLLQNELHATKVLRGRKLKRQVERDCAVPVKLSVTEKSSTDIWTSKASKVARNVTTKTRGLAVYNDGSISLPPLSYNSNTAAADGAGDVSVPGIIETVGRVLSNHERRLLRQKKMAERLAKIAAAALAEEPLSELAGGLFGDDDKDVVQDDVDDVNADDKPVPKKGIGKITSKQRRRRGEDKRQRGMVAREKAAKKKMNIEFSQLRKICNEADEEASRVRSVAEPATVKAAIERRRSASRNQKMQRLPSVRLLQLRQANAVADEFVRQKEVAEQPSNNNDCSLRLVNPIAPSDLLLDRFVAAQAQRGLLTDCRSHSEPHRRTSGRRPMRRGFKEYEIRRDEEEFQQQTKKKQTKQGRA